MVYQKLISKIILIGLIATSILLWGFAKGSTVSSKQCDLAKLQQYELEFDISLAQKKVSNRKDVSEDISIIARRYIDMNNNCYDELYSKNLDQNSNQILIDSGAARVKSDSLGRITEDTSVINTKWGEGSPFDPNNVTTSSGGLVTYSFMANGIANTLERPFFLATDTNQALSSMISYEDCFEYEFSRAFAMWSAVANIRFLEVGDGRGRTNAEGVGGDIRIGAHTFDGPGRMLAHAFSPPPNGGSVAGDIHFDKTENWTCDSSGVDIGIVATHEIGHAIGLDDIGHNTGALMNPVYDSTNISLTSDDIEAAVAIYGPSVATEPVKMVSFFLDDQLVVIPTNRRSPACSEDIGVDPSINLTGTWEGSCVSINRPDMVARYYNFRLSTTQDVTIDLSSSRYTLLQLSSNGQRIKLDDNSGDDEGRSGSLMRVILPAGFYSIEATSFSERGDFKISVESNTISPLCEAEDLGSLPNVTIDSAWNEICVSRVGINNYSRFYEFSVPTFSRISINLSHELGSRPGIRLYDDNGELLENLFRTQQDFSLAEGRYRLEVLSSNFFGRLGEGGPNRSRGFWTGPFTLTINSEEFPTSCNRDLGLDPNVAFDGEVGEQCIHSRFGRLSQFNSFELSQPSIVELGFLSENVGITLKDLNNHDQIGLRVNGPFSYGQLITGRVPLSEGRYFIELQGSINRRNIDGFGDFSLSMKTISQPDSCTEDIGLLVNRVTKNVEGSWDGSCASADSPDNNARRYVLEVEQQRLSISFSSDPQAYIRIWRDGVIFRPNRNPLNFQTGGKRTYVITEGTYIVEVNTTKSDTVRDFSLSFTSETPGI